MIGFFLKNIGGPSTTYEISTVTGGFFGIRLERDESYDQIVHDDQDRIGENTVSKRTTCGKRALKDLELDTSSDARISPNDPRFRRSFLTSLTEKFYRLPSTLII